MARGGITAKDPFGNPIQPVTGSPNEPAYSLLPSNPTNAQGIYGITTADGTPYGAATPVTTQVATANQNIVNTASTTTDTETSTEGMKTTFFINKNCVRISVLTLDGKPISSVPADFSEYVEDTPENSARFGCSITGQDGVTDSTDSTESDTIGTSVSVDDDNSNSDDTYNAETAFSGLSGSVGSGRVFGTGFGSKYESPEGVRKDYENSGVIANDPLQGAKDALSGAFKVSKGLGSLLTSIPKWGLALGVGAGALGATGQLTALSKAQANLKMAEFLGRADDAAAIQKEIDTFLKGAPNVVSSLDSVFAKGDERFNTALSASLSEYASEGTVLNVEGLNEVGKKNLEEALGYEYVAVPLTGGGAIATNPKSAGSTASSYTAPKSDDGFNQGFFTPGETTVRPPTRPSSVTPTKTDPISTPATTESKGLYESLTGTKFKDTNVGKAIGLGSDSSSEPTVDSQIATKLASTNDITVEDLQAASIASSKAAESNNNNNNNSDDTSSSGGGGCCFIMLEARYGNGVMDEVVRKYRDEYMTDRNRRGYYKVAEVLVPLMRKSKVFKWVVTKAFADPLVSYGKYYYGENKVGVVFAPLKNFWMKVFDVVGGDTKFIRESGEVV
tara:strand:+ start:1 stop:1854 length:1854 start_codon:yes stop_codon:yes gene_type:complete